MWMDVVYEPGILKVVAFDDQGNPVKETSVSTAGQPKQIVLETDRTKLIANGEDLAFITVSVVDKAGNPCPTATNALDFKVSGEGQFKAVCNGDATSLEPFHQPHMRLFSGKLVVTVSSTEESGELKLSVSGKNLDSASLEITTE